MKLRKECDHELYDRHLVYSADQSPKWCAGGNFLTDAALVIERVAPKTCDTCKGSGEGHFTDSSGPISSNIYICPKCRGLGRVYPSDLVKQLTAETGDWERAIAVLDALFIQKGAG